MSPRKKWTTIVREYVKRTDYIRITDGTCKTLKEMAHDVGTLAGIATLYAPILSQHLRLKYPRVYAESRAAEGVRRGTRLQRYLTTKEQHDENS